MYSRNCTQKKRFHQNRRLLALPTGLQRDRTVQLLRIRRLQRAPCSPASLPRAYRARRLAAPAVRILGHLFFLLFPLLSFFSPSLYSPHRGHSPARPPDAAPPSRPAPPSPSRLRHVAPAGASLVAPPRRWEGASSPSPSPPAAPPAPISPSALTLEGLKHSVQRRLPGSISLGRPTRSVEPPSASLRSDSPDPGASLR